MSKLQLDTISENTLVEDVIHYPLFKNYGTFIFPSLPNLGMTISKIDSLLPYHTCIQNNTTIEVVKYMINQVNDNKIIFYDIYSEEEKKDNPAKEKTGLFFFKGTKNAPFAIISAGGGFSYVGSIHESFPHALELSKHGYNAFALQYRTGSANVACEDLAKAIAFVFENATLLEVDITRYSLWGGSAGARMAAYLGSYGTSAFIQKDYPKPNAIIMQYTGHSDYTKNDPSTYVCVGENDWIASWKVMANRIHHLNRIGIETEFHKYSNLGHGFGLGIGTSAEGWIKDAITFWQNQNK